MDKIAAPAVHPDMLWPLLIMAIAFKLMYAALVLQRGRDEILFNEQNMRWVKDLIKGGER